VSLWNDLKARLGLADDHAYYDDEYYDDEDAVDGYDPIPTVRSPYEGESTSVRKVSREPDLDRARSGGYANVSSGPGMQAVPQVKMQIVEPRTFSEAQAIADRFKTGVPVIMNLTMTDAELAKRFIDFASGLTYGLNGGLQKVADRVFMLTPANVEVSAEQRRVLRDKGLFEFDA
jgi:cell division inhibitor SepF